MYNIYRAINTEAVSEYISHATIVVNPAHSCTVPATEEVKEQQVEETEPEAPAESAHVVEEQPVEVDPVVEEKPVKKTRGKKAKE